MKKPGSVELKDRSRSEDRTKIVFAELQNDIVFGRLKPRERLVEEELGTRFDVGRHVIRAAIEELDRHGLVRRRANRGAVVSDYTPEEVNELYDMRTILQREAAERIVLPAPPELIAELTAVNADYMHYLETDALNLASTANDRFHQLVFGACGNRYLAHEIQQYWVKTAAIHSYAIANKNLSKQSRDEHLRIIEAMAGGDRATLVRLCVDHMLPALEAYKAVHGGWSSPATMRG